MLQTLRYGPLAEMLAMSADGLSEAALVGPGAELAGCQLVDGGSDIITADTFAAILAAGPAFTRAPIQPITEQSEAVNG
jgi:hypothetical protein